MAQSIIQREALNASAAAFSTILAFGYNNTGFTVSFNKARSNYADNALMPVFTVYNYNLTVFNMRVVFNNLNCRLGDTAFNTLSLSISIRYFAGNLLSLGFIL